MIRSGDDAVRGAAGPVLTLLLLVRSPECRGQLRRALESPQHAVIGVGSIGEALARLRRRHYDLVICAEFDRGAQLEDHFGILIDANGLLSGCPGRDALYLPGIGIQTRAVLLVPSADAARARAALVAALARLATPPVRT